MKRTNYPAPNGTYKICVNHKAPWQSYETCRLQISVGKPNYEGEKFEALCEWAGARFERTVLIVSDTLQRHNLRYQRNCDAATAWKLSRLEGETWLRRNARALHHLRTPEIVRWDQLLMHPAYQVIETTPALDQAIEHTIREFWGRHEYDPTLYFAFHHHSRAFLLEELSVFSYLFNDPAIDVYAGSWFHQLMAVLFPYKDYLGIDYVRNRKSA